jgi:tetratricopeptide (TPR) repeat protein
MLLGGVLFLVMGGVFVRAFVEAADEPATVAAAHVNDVFDIANEEYKAGNFEDALRLYEGLLSSTDVETADIYYNIGNAQFKLGNLGKAIVSYRRALARAPRDEDIAANLRYVRERIRDSIAQTKSTEVLREVFFFHYSLNDAESEAVFFCAYLGLVLFASLSLLSNAKPLRWLTFVALAIALIFGCSTAMKRYGSVQSKQAVVVAEETEVRTGPGRNYMKSFDLHDGVELRVQKNRDGWCQIELSDGRRGWLHDSDIERV